MDKRYAEFLKWIRHNHPTKMDRVLDSLSPNQIECKEWLVNELSKVYIPRNTEGKFNVEIVGGWFGFPLIQYLMEKYPDQINRIWVWELDEFCKKAIYRYCVIFGYDIKKFAVFNRDFFDTSNRSKARAHLIINTSCEHMPDMPAIKQYYESPERTLLVLQSNNKMDEPDHSNCVLSCQELSEKNDIHELHGSYKTLSSGKDDYWQRFMVMGKWK